VRAVTNTRRLLKIISEHGARATCFVLGSVAESYPTLVREIHEAGHEIASHGYAHRPIYWLNAEEFRNDVRRSLESLEHITGERVRGYRAPYFSLTSRAIWALPILAELGLQYDASIFPLRSRYYRFPGWDGAGDAPRFPCMLDLGESRLLEVPAMTVRIWGQNLPLAGGAFLRLVPLGLFRWAIRSANRVQHPAVFYLHPHDLDARDLRGSFPDETLKRRLTRWGWRVGRSGNERKLRKLLAEFSFTSIREWMEANRTYATVRAEYSVDGRRSVG